MPGLYHEYKRLVTPSEVSNEFHLFVFMNMISAVAGDRLWFMHGYDKVYLNLWTMLLGLSGHGRKTTATSPAIQILDKMGANILASQGSQEGFIKELQDKKGVGLMHHPEFGSFLGQLGKDYMGGFVDFLCQVYDPSAAALRKRLSNDDIMIEHLSVSWLSATTPDSMNRYDADSRVASGFMPRWNIVFGSAPLTYFNHRPPGNPGHFDKFVSRLIGMLNPQKGHAVTGKMMFSPDALWGVHKGWYDKMRPVVDGGNLGSFQMRIFEVVKKYACLLAWIENRATVDPKYMDLALEFGDYFLGSAKRLLTEEISQTPFERDCQKVIRAIRRGKTDSRAICQGTKLRGERLNECARALNERGQLQLSKERGFEIIES